MTRDEERFWSKVQVAGPLDCWPWMRGKSARGYGQAKFRGKTERSHRVAYLLDNGPIADRLCVCHACDNPSCCNPGHLWLGTHGDNNRDMAAKGRAVSPKLDHSKIPHARGEESNLAKITAAAVVEIRSRRASGERRGLIAKDFGISPTHVWAIAARKVWRHV
jgi:hypothetical protein